MLLIRHKRNRQGIKKIPIMFLNAFNYKKIYDTQIVWAFILLQVYFKQLNCIERIVRHWSFLVLQNSLADYNDL